MGRPRMIIVIRHAQSEGNQNRQIHQTIPDHRVQLTPDGWTQAHEAGRRLRSMLKSDDTLQIYTSPYRRTRETTEGILRSLTSDSPSPSPFNREAIKVWEEPRLREQDFGNFQPDSAAMGRMWKERADYGHFFFRIPNGESAADAYDRVSGFNESLWRSFSEKDFPSVCVLVTHGLMTRVFLMKWFHWSVEYFEDLRNVNHCEFVVMTRPENAGKYILKNELRTWSELRRRAAAEKGEASDDDQSAVGRKRQGECPDDCDHEHDEFLKRPKLWENSKDAQPYHPPTNKLSKSKHASSNPHSDHPAQSHLDPKTSQSGSTCNPSEEDSEAFPSSATITTIKVSSSSTTNHAEPPNSIGTAFAFSQHLADAQRPRLMPNYMEGGRDFGGSFSGAATPAAPGSPSGGHSRRPSVDYGFPSGTAAPKARGSRGSVDEEGQGLWAGGSATGGGARADALGDQEQDRVEDDVGGAEEIGRAKAGEAAGGGKGVGKTDVGEEVLERIGKKDR